jgi:hypothetical protein
LAEWDEMKKLYRGPYIDAFCQVWFHLVQLFQRSRLKYEKLTDGRRMPSDGGFLWKVVLKTIFSETNNLIETKLREVLCDFLLQSLFCFQF